MKKTKDCKGISLVILIITITVMLIITGATIYVNNNLVTTSQDKTKLTELEQIKHFVGESYLNYSKTQNRAFLVGDKLTAEQINEISTNAGVSLISIPEDYNENLKSYYRLTPVSLLKLGVQNAKDTYVVNYLTGEVINTTSLRTSTGRVLYTYIRNSFSTNDVTDMQHQTNTTLIEQERELFNSL